MENLDKIMKELKKTGMKQTPQRIEVVRALLKLKEKHPTLNQVYNEAKKKVPTLSFSTLYTIVKKLEELGVIKLFDLLGETRIEVNNKPHINIIDLSNGEIDDYNDDSLVKEIVEETGLDRSDFVLINILVYKEKTSK
ncbi:MAG: transcriptional repressor [Desulfurococcales archaeon]|nr:transcriptional repressor [Desulfurococcales archaeon]